jgi:hypothetical protein
VTAIGFANIVFASGETITPKNAPQLMLIK